jgi:hypothetical protein
VDAIQREACCRKCSIFILKAARETRRDASLRTRHQRRTLLRF